MRSPMTQKGRSEPIVTVLDGDWRTVSMLNPFGVRRDAKATARLGDAGVLPEADEVQPCDPRKRHGVGRLLVGQVETGCERIGGPLDADNRKNDDRSTIAGFNCLATRPRNSPRHPGKSNQVTHPPLPLDDGGAPRQHTMAGMDYLDVADRTWPILTRLMRGHAAVYRATGGRVGYKALSVRRRSRVPFGPPRRKKRTAQIGR